MFFKMLVIISYSIFKKNIKYDDIIEFVNNEKYQYLVVSFRDDLFYSFDLTLQAERKNHKNNCFG